MNIENFINQYKDAVKLFDEEGGERRVKVYLNDELKGTFYSAIVIGIPVANGVFNKEDFRMDTYVVGPFNIALYLMAQLLFNELVDEKIKEYVENYGKMERMQN